VTQEQIAAAIREYIITPVLGDLLDQDTKIFINPTGIFNI
jgi:S-adenosylmethionine synthetase